MQISDLRTNHLENPMGFWFETPTFSFTVSSQTQRHLKAARVQVALDRGFEHRVLDTGWQGELCPAAFTPGLKLEPCTRYYWRAGVQGDKGAEAYSQTAWFETAKGDMPWAAHWITAPEGLPSHPLMRKTFTLNHAPASARIYACGLGLYELYINGTKAGDEVLAPFCNDYDLWLQYQTYDVTELLRPGENTVSVMLGEGWYMGRFGFDHQKRPKALFGDRFALLLEGAFRLEDGSEVALTSDTTWEVLPSPVVSSNIYDGEVYDARLLSPQTAQAALPIDMGHERLVPRLSPPVTVSQRLSPVTILLTPKGETVLDFGQNLTGWVTFHCDLPQGESISLQYGEVLQEGCFYRDNLRSAQAAYTYRSDGTQRQVRPHFTFYGFRYVKVVCSSPLETMGFEACVIHSQLPQTGWIETGQPKVNRLFLNALWGQRGNFLDVPTDCPQRDERMGWTGDAQVFATTACYNLYSPAFFRKYLYDMNREQAVAGGAVPYTVPDMIRIGDLSSADSAAFNSHGSCGWGDAATVIPHTLYRHYGDKALLEAQYTGMKAWVDYIHRCDQAQGNRRLWQSGFHFADWLALDNPDPHSAFGGTDPYFIASAYYRHSALLTAQAAQALGHTAEAEHYRALSQAVKEAMINAYFHRGELALDTQTAMVVSLYMDIVPEGNRTALAARLNDKIAANNGHLTTGFVGTPYLCPVLTANGYVKTAYDLLLNEDYPGWLYSINLGATTIWERWNAILPDGKISDTGMNSLNHYAYGSIVQWLYETVGGLRPVWRAPGFARFHLCPQPDPRLGWARVQYRAATGDILSAWRYADGQLHYEIQVPFNTQAELSLVGVAPAQIIGFESSHGDVFAPSQGEKGLCLQLEAGQYRITVAITKGD